MEQLKRFLRDKGFALALLACLVAAAAAGVWAVRTVRDELKENLDGLNDENLQQTPFGKRSTASSFGARRPSSTTGTATAGTTTTTGSSMNMPSFSLPTMNATPFGATKTPSSTVQKKDIQIPDFLRNR